MRPFLRTLFIAGVPFGIFWGLYFGSGKDLSAAVWSGVVAGLVAGLAAALIERFRQQMVSTSPPVMTDEVLVRKGRAHHEGLTGWLYLTDRRLLFEGYPTDETAPEVSTLLDGRGTDDPEHVVSIPVAHIADVVSKQPLGVFARLDIVLSDGRTKSFDTEDLTDWVDGVATARQKYLDEPRSENKKLFP